MDGIGRAAPRQGIAAALAAAVLFGVGTPIAKLLLPGTGPLLLAGLLYLGAGLGLFAVGLLRRAGGTVNREAPLRRGDVVPIAAIVACGGVIAPILMLIGLERVPAVTASLLLNLESVLSILLAVALFGEHLGRREAGAALLVIGGAAVIGYEAGDLGGRWLGVLAISAACLGWAVDNNLTQRLSLRDPIAVARVKCLAAGAINLALAAGHALPPLPHLAAALAIGVVSYGVSLTLAVRALRLLGAARQAAFFATAPFVGALAAVPLLGERMGPQEIAAAAAMATGVTLLARERHAHLHVHESVEHEHQHVHDVHHQHEHGDAVDVGEPHTHRHVHPRLAHTHPHVSDAHHRHRH